MQRVAIARALVNDPDIVLADEPTGALDTETGEQVMGLLAEIAKDRLVIMVTHNPALAQEYATRIVRLKDGRITDDSDPFVPTADDLATATGRMPANGAEELSDDTEELHTTSDDTVELPADADNTEELPADSTTPLQPDAMHGDKDDTADAAQDDGSKAGHKRKASMSFLTALSLSFSNLMTKKGRTILTAVAGSMGIFGIAAILALSNGVNNYIAKVEQDTLSSYPLSIEKTSYNLTNLFTENSSNNNANTSDTSSDSSSGVINEKTMISDMFADIKNNDLSSFKSYIESGQSNINDYVTTIQYDYGITPQIYESNTSDGIVRLNPSSISDLMGSSSSTSSSSSSMMSTNVFQEMLNDQDLLDEQYDVKVGRWAENYDECVLVLSKNGSISDYTLYNIGVLNPADLRDMAQKAMNSEKVDTPNTNVNYTYDDALNTTFKVVNSCNLYRHNSDHDTWTDMSNDTDYMTQQVNDGTTMKVVGVVQPKQTTSSPALSQGIAYSTSLTKHLMTEASQSDIVKQQLSNHDVDVFTGKTFDELQDSQNNSLDMSSMFTIDENALSSAFSFDMGSGDTSASASGMDMSSVDVSSMFSNMPLPDFSSATMNLSSEQRSQIDSISNQLVTGFFAYYFAQHPGQTISSSTDLSADIEGYLSTSTAQTLMEGVAGIGASATSTQVQTIMQDYMSNTLVPYLEQAMKNMVSQMASAMATSMQQSVAAASGSGISVDSNAFANAIQFNMTQDDLTSLLTNYATSNKLTYDNNISTLGYAEESNPASIKIYPTDFEDKEKVLTIIDDYNQQMKDQGKEDQVISYTDIMGTLISSVTTIVNMISMVLIAFVSISLVVSSIMIGIITYISVLERKKEIGILRAMGASKRNIANVFNAETVIEGLIAGVIAVVAVWLLSIPVNIIVLNTHNVAHIMSLSWISALVLIGISVLLTFIAGLIPSQAAARRDPVEALRSE